MRQAVLMQIMFWRRAAQTNPPPSFRDGPKDQTRNLEIPGSMLAHRPGMTEQVTGIAPE
jgi:hypothetical protein